MKRLVKYITEAITSNLKQWFTNIVASQKALIVDNKPQQFEVNTKLIKGPTVNATLKDVIATKEEMEIINDPLVGFPVTSTAIKNYQKTILDENLKDISQVMVSRYFYVTELQTYYIGICLYNDTVPKYNGYVNLYGIETLQGVQNVDEMLKFMFMNLINVSKKTNHKGILYNITNQNLKQTLTKLGFKPSKDNKNWLIYEIK